jgi:hypothetical protein
MHAEKNKIEKKTNLVGAWPAVALVVEVGAKLRRRPDLRGAQTGVGRRIGVDKAARAREGILFGRRQELQGRAKGGGGC